MTTTTGMQTAVKFFNTEKGYGFFRHEGNKDVFVHITMLERHGFTAADMATDTEAIIDVGPGQKGGLQTIKIRSIGKKRATLRLPAEVTPPRPSTPVYKRRYAEYPVTTDPETGIALVGIYHTGDNEGMLAQYVLRRADKNGRLNVHRPLRDSLMSEETARQELRRLSALMLHRERETAGGANILEFKQTG